MISLLPRSRVLLEKLPTFYGIRRSFHWHVHLSLKNTVQSTLTCSHVVKIHLNFMISYTIIPSNGLFHSGFPTELLQEFLIIRMDATCSAHLNLRLIIKLHIMHSSQPPVTFSVIYPVTGMSHVNQQMKIWSWNDAKEKAKINDQHNLRIRHHVASRWTTEHIISHSNSKCDRLSAPTSGNIWLTTVYKEP